MKNSNIKDFKSRPTFSGFISNFGIVAALLALVLIFVIGGFFILLGVLLFLAALPFILLLYGIKIDFHNKQIMPYVNFLVYKSGSWHSTKKYDSVVLMRFREQEMTHYEVHFKGHNLDLFVIDFVDYNKAYNFLKECSVKLELSAIDEVKNERDKIKSYRSDRFRR